MPSFDRTREAGSKSTMPGGCLSLYLHPLCVSYWYWLSLNLSSAFCLLSSRSLSSMPYGGILNLTSSSRQNTRYCQGVINRSLATQLYLCLSWVVRHLWLSTLSPFVRCQWASLCPSPQVRHIWLSTLPPFVRRQWASLRPSLWVCHIWLATHSHH